MVNKVINTINKYNMIQYGDNVIVGLSGGADSVCLLWILNFLKKDLGIKLTAIHVHHGIRGQAADEDVLFAESFCQELNIPLEVVYRDIKEEAKRLRISEEEAGRKARYEIFGKRSIELGEAKIALGHHQNDQAETILFNVIRGSGLKGLGGIRPSRDLIIRPLIKCTRSEIESYCNENNLTYQEDETNQLLVYTRNKIRQELIPYIEKNLNPNFVNQMSNMSELLQEEEAYLEQQALAFYKRHSNKNNKADVCFDVNQLLNTHCVIRKRVYRKAIMDMGIALKDFEYKHINIIEDLLNKKTGKRVDLPYGVFVEKVYNELCFKIKKEYKKPWLHTIDKGNGTFYINEAKGTFELRVLQNENISEIPRNNYTKWFDYDKIKSNYLTVRNRQDGDYIYLKGLNGKKKLKDFFIDLKVPRDERNHIPLLVDHDELIWVIGYRISEMYKVTDETTRILEVKYIKEDF